MRAVAKDLLAMKVTKLKEELEARGAGPRASLGQKKAWLRRRLHVAIVREHRREREEAPQKIAHLEARQLIHLYVFTGILCICTLICMYKWVGQWLWNYDRRIGRRAVAFLNHAPAPCTHGWRCQFILHF